MPQYIESDEELRRRIAQKYGMWGAFLTAVMECKGPALDDCAKAIGLERIVVDRPEGDNGPSEF